mgnify:CR=1 FL=1
MARLIEHYKKEVVPALLKEFGFGNPMQTPKLEKIVVNCGVGEATQNPKILEAAMGDIAAITGQKPKVCRSRLSVAAFKLRKGMSVGCQVTLRGRRMYEFYDRLVNVALPRIRDFRGVPTKSFDGRGNYTLGIKEHIIFPEINIDKVNKINGMNVTFVTNARSDEEGFALLTQLGLPFKNIKKN